MRLGRGGPSQIPCRKSGMKGAVGHIANLVPPLPPPEACLGPPKFPSTPKPAIFFRSGPVERKKIGRVSDAGEPEGGGGGAQDLRGLHLSCHFFGTEFGRGWAIASLMPPRSPPERAIQA